MFGSKDFVAQDSKVGSSTSDTQQATQVDLPRVPTGGAEQSAAVRAVQAAPGFSGEYFSREREHETCKVEPYPSAAMFRPWNYGFKQNVSNASGWRLAEAFEWISYVEKATDIDQLRDDGTFPSLSAKVATALMSIAPEDLRREITLMGERAALETPVRRINGRMIYFLVLQRFKAGAQESALYELEDLIETKLKGDDLKSFLIDWKTTLYTCGKSRTTKCWNTCSISKFLFPNS